jgi:hypothetical protein
LIIQLIRKCISKSNGKNLSKNYQIRFVEDSFWDEDAMLDKKQEHLPL